MVFKPSLASSAWLIVLVVLFARLGAWQLQRGAEKEQRISGFEAAERITGLPAPDSVTEFTRLVLRGSFDPQKHILADNQVFERRPGVHVYSPFHLNGGSVILVNRGWLPFATDRANLPAVVSVPGSIEISGRIGPIPRPGRQLGAARPMNAHEWPQLLTYPEHGRIAAALGIELYPWILFLDRSSPGGFGDRSWSPVYMSPDRHRAYAFQWFALALATLVTWSIMGVRRGKQP